MTKKTYFVAIQEGYIREALPICPSNYHYYKLSLTDEAKSQLIALLEVYNLIQFKYGAYDEQGEAVRNIYNFMVGYAVKGKDKEFLKRNSVKKEA